MSLRFKKQVDEPLMYEGGQEPGGFKRFSIRSLADISHTDNHHKVKKEDGTVLDMVRSSRII